MDLPTPSTSFTSSSTSSFSSSVHSRHFIRSKDQVLLKLPSGIIKPIQVADKGSINLGKYGNFKSNELVGKVYGQTYEILKGGKLELVEATLNEIEETAANNEHIESTGAQNLTFVDIKALKDSGLTGREIIQKQIEEHKSYELKTEYSKEKYMKRKEAKYIPIFTALPPTIHQLTSYNFDRVPSKTRDLRPDTLANLLAMANVRPGSRLLVVENLGGLIVGAAVERMGGTGRIMIINDADSPPDLHLVESFNFSPLDLEPIQSVHWAATEPEWNPPDLPLDSEPIPIVEENNKKSVGGTVAEEVEDTRSEEEKEKEMKRLRNLRNKVQRESVKLKKRRATFERMREMREEFFRGEYDGLIIASEYEPYSIIERLIPRLAGSAPIVVYSPYLQPLFPALMSLRQNPLMLHPTIHEPFLRQYQVLPGRCHPEMQGMSAGGFLLSCIRVIDLGDANSVRVGQGRKRVNGSGSGGTVKKGEEGVEEKEEEGGEGEEGREEKRRKVEVEGGEEKGEMQVDDTVSTSV